MKTKDCKKLNLQKSKTWQLKETLELTTFVMLMETQSLIQKKKYKKNNNNGTYVESLQNLRNYNQN